MPDQGECNLSAMIKKQQIKQRIFAILVVFFMLFMVAYQIFRGNYSKAATDAGVGTQAIITGGELSIDAQGQVNYTDTSLNVTPTNTTGNLTQVNMRDSRGTGAGWTVTGVANDMQAGTNTISNVYVTWAPGDVYGLEGSSTDGVAAGPDYSGNFGDGSRTLINASAQNGMGIYCINGTLLNLYVGPGVAAGTYQNTLLLTIS